jgi:zona occludens toxin
MSIVAYVGLPGHGKSYGVVDNVILPSLKNKRMVYTNIPMNQEKCLDDFGMAVVPFDITDIVKNPYWFTQVFVPGSIFVLDEVWRLWPAGLKASSVREQDKEFLAEHRHLVGDNGYSTEIYLVTQDLSQVANFARALVENTFRMVKRSNIGLHKRFRVDVYFGAVTGNKPSVKQREREIHGGVFKKEVYAYYQSHTKSATGEAGDESRTDKRFNALGKLSIKLALLFILVAIPLAYLGFNKLARAYGVQPAHQAVTPQPERLRTPSSVSPSTPSQLSPSTKPMQRANVVTTAHPPFLSKAKNFFIAFVEGSRNAYRYHYHVYFQDAEVSLNAAQLTLLGYSLTPINECLVKVVGSDYVGFIMCRKSEYKDRGIMGAIATDLVSTSEPLR